MCELIVQLSLDIFGDWFHDPCGYQRLKMPSVTYNLCTSSHILQIAYKQIQVFLSGIFFPNIFDQWLVEFKNPWVGSIIQIVLSIATLQISLSLSLSLTHTHTHTHTHTQLLQPLAVCNRKYHKVAL